VKLAGLSITRADPAEMLIWQMTNCERAKNAKSPTPPVIKAIIQIFRFALRAGEGWIERDNFPACRLFYWH
jgi:hypothetical protein